MDHSGVHNDQTADIKLLFQLSYKYKEMLYKNGKIQPQSYWSETWQTKLNYPDGAIEKRDC